MRFSFPVRSAVCYDQKLQLVACLVAGKKVEQNHRFRRMGKEEVFGQGATDRQGGVVRPRLDARPEDPADAAASAAHLCETAGLDDWPTDKGRRVRSERSSATRAAYAGGPASGA